MTRPARDAVAVLLALGFATGCGGSSGGTSPTGAIPATWSPAELPPAPEPAVAPVPAVPPVGRVVGVGGPVEGVVVDGPTRTVAAALRERRLALLDADSGRVRTMVGVPGTARHLQLAVATGTDQPMVLVPGEDTDLLVQVGLPGGAVVASTRVGRQPHDAAYDGGSQRIAVADELGGSVSFIEGERSVTQLPGPVQPGGLAVAAGRAGVVDVRGATLFVYDVAAAREIGRLPAGNGPTHATPLGRRVGAGADVLVADTRGNALLVYALDGTPRQVTRVDRPGAPYGLAVDERRGRVYVALSATNELLRYDVATDGNLRPVGPPIPTVQQPNSVGVDPQTGKLFIGSSSPSGTVQMVAPPEG